jgi:hypothetical protein
LETIRITGNIMLVLSLANALALLFLQATAYRRHRHQSFFLLTVSTVIALISNVVMALPLFVPAARSWYSSIFITGTILYFIYATLGIWGVASLFRSYGALRQSA